MFPELREDVYGADGRWFRRGIAEGKVGSDRAACYSGRVCQYLMRFRAVRPERTEVVTRVGTRLLIGYERAFFCFMGQ